nr:MAG TPA: hypothetical protein [Caudoviricetes sp.]
MSFSAQAFCAISRINPPKTVEFFLLTSAKMCVDVIKCRYVAEVKLRI